MKQTKPVRREIRPPPYQLPFPCPQGRAGRRTSSQRGFTLVELMVTLGLTAILIPALLKLIQTIRVQTAATSNDIEVSRFWAAVQPILDCNATLKALNSHMDRQGCYPVTSGDGDYTDGHLITTKGQIITNPYGLVSYNLRCGNIPNSPQSTHGALLVLPAVDGTPRAQPLAGNAGGFKLYPCGPSSCQTSDFEGCGQTSPLPQDNDGQTLVQYSAIKVDGFKKPTAGGVLTYAAPPSTPLGSGWIQSVSLLGALTYDPSSDLCTAVTPLTGDSSWSSFCHDWTSMTDFYLYFTTDLWLNGTCYDFQLGSGLNSGAFVSIAGTSGNGSSLVQTPVACAPEAQAASCQKKGRVLVGGANFYRLTFGYLKSSTYPQGSIASNKSFDLQYRQCPPGTDAASDPDGSPPTSSPPTSYTPIPVTALRSPWIGGLQVTNNTTLVTLPAYIP